MILALVSLAVCSCGTSQRSVAHEVRAPVARAPAAAQPGDAALLAAGNATFAGRLLDLLSRTQPTIALSPFSISDVLAMAYAGAQGQTASQMAAALDFRLPPDRLHPAFNALSLSLAAINRPGATLSVANALYGQQGLAFRSAFLGLLARDYGTGVRTVDFEHAAQAARTQINGWVALQTQGKIPHLLAPGDVDEAARLVLVNAVYLNAKWQSPFLRSATSPTPFHAPSGTVNVPTMSQTGTFGYRRHAGYGVLQLPYVGGRLAFDVLLPDPGQLPALMRQLRDGGLPAALSGLRGEDVELQLPKLQLRTRFELSSALGALGMPVAFGDRADFAGIAGPPGELRISSVIHEAYIRVDEAGTEAAAATGAGFSSSAAPGPRPIQFLVNRPFVFVLRDTTTNAILFAGTVSRPED
jgi:serpin B